MVCSSLSLEGCDFNVAVFGTFIVADRPALHTLEVPFDPPAIPHPETWDAIHSRLHATRAGRFEWSMRVCCRERPFSSGVLRKVHVQKIDRNSVTGETGDQVSPAANLDFRAGEKYGDERLNRIEDVFRISLLRLFALLPSFVEVLAKITFAVQKGHAHHGDPRVLRRLTQCVACQNAEPPAIRWKTGVYGDFHREIGDAHIRGLGGHSALSLIRSFELTLPGPTPGV